MSEEMSLEALLRESNRWNAVLVARADRLVAMLGRPGVADRFAAEEHHHELAASAHLMDSLTTTLTAALARADAAEALLREAAEVLGELLDDCEPARPGSPRLSLLKIARDLERKIKSTAS